MKACVIVDNTIRIEQRPDPVAGLGEVLVRVRAAGLNGADLSQLKGFYPAPPGWPADIPGLEFAGEVVASGPGATRFSAGDRVMGIVGGGGQAELIAVSERTVMPVPAGIGWPEAGGLPETFCTAFDAIFTQAGLLTCEKLLINGGAGGVGTSAIQLARAVGARVWTTIRRPELADKVTALGATVVAAEEVAAAGPFDVVLELVGGPNLASDLDVLATGGRICVIGVGGGATAELNALQLMVKRARIHGSTLRARPLEEKAIVARLIERRVLPDFETGTLTVPVDATFPIDRAADAYAAFAEGGKFGKIVITM
jgi:putative PIG3 family NAD(P)H quinone oxidoreductase